MLIYLTTGLAEPAKWVLRPNQQMRVTMNALGFMVYILMRSILSFHPQQRMPGIIQISPGTHDQKLNLLWNQLAGQFFKYARNVLNIRKLGAESLEVPW